MPPIQDWLTPIGDGRTPGAERRRQPPRLGVDAAGETDHSPGVAGAKTVIPSVDAVHDFVGQTLGPSDWVPISQERIDLFADATDDHQWIHTDPERASRDTVWKTTIAHGYLTLGLTPYLLGQVLEIRNCTSAVNTGLEKARLAAPVPAGSRVRLRAEIRDARNVPNGGVRASFAVRIEVEGSSKPALLANVNYVYFP